MKQLVFVIEEEIAVRELARRCLEDAGYEVCTFSAERVIEEGEKMPPSLMLIALAAARGNGIELCRRVRENQAMARTPLVFLIPDGPGENRVLALESGG